MEYIHVKSLEKYHPTYKDRNLIWCKVYFTMINADPDFEMLCEIDKWRFICFIMLEIQTKKPIPLDDGYLRLKGFDLKKRPIRLTLQMLHNFIEVEKLCALEVEVEVEKEVEVDIHSESVTDFLNYFNLKTNKNLSLTKDREKIIKQRLSEYTIDCLKTAVDNFITDDWQDRHKFCDIIYCIGIRNKIDNLEKWLNHTPKKTFTKAQIQTIKNREEWKNDRANIG